MTETKSSDHQTHKKKERDDEEEPYLDVREMSAKYAKDLISFSTPDNPTKEEEVLVAEIVQIDHRSLHALKPGTQEREEVKWLLVNAVTCLQSREDFGASYLVKKAELIFHQHLQAKNRIRYLLGMLMGVLVSMALGTLIMLITSFTLPAIAPGLLGLLFLFAGMGSITSVLTRLNKIDLSQQTSNYMIMVSGGTRPVVAIFFSIVVYFILETKILNIDLGSQANDQNGVYLITSFLCGFSERFATDIISRAGLFSRASNDKEKLNEK